MEIRRPSFLLLSLVLFLTNSCDVFCRLTPDASADRPQTYIIQVEKPAQAMDEDGLKIWHKSFLPESLTDNSDRLVHSYSEVFSGFSAKLSAAELQSLKEKEGFVRAFPDRVLPLLTSHTPAFLGLKQGRGLWQSAKLGAGVIIGLLDSGLTPGHPSFDDDGIPAPPSKWKGSCDFGSRCNNKLIGAKDIISSGGAPTDDEGHGTHTASTAAGNFVRNVSISLAGGTLSGMAPRSHLAIYRVCSTDGCSLADVLAGLDAGVKDGVDVLSLSLGGSSLPLEEDPLAIGAFGAVEKDVFVSCAAGNSGPTPSSLSNEAPWILTVAASTTDRRLRASIKLGNGDEISGESLDQSSELSGGDLPLLYSSSCESLGSEAQGKVVVCQQGDSSGQSLAGSIEAAGGVALILVNSDGQGSVISLRSYNFPSATVSQKDGASIISYATSSSDPTATIHFDGAVLGASPAPVVAYFSSRGPSLANPSIIKPDISAPGVNILAAWISDGSDRAGYSIISGTSMATPHMSGIAALIKSVHPKWSPAAIKSAIMTTSDDRANDDGRIQDETGLPASFFAMGAGHVNPSKAADPGLVYDLSIDDYIGFICGKFGNAGSIVRDRTVDCSAVKNISESELNYPSILLVPGSGGVTVSRTVTNVGPASSSYKLQLEDLPTTVSVTVTPKTLSFTKANQKKSFKVTAEWVGNPPSSSFDFVSGNLKWVSGKHVVRSPIVIAASASA